MYLSVFVTLCYYLLLCALFLLYCVCVCIYTGRVETSFLTTHSWLVKEKQCSFYFSGFSAVTFTQHLT